MISMSDITIRSAVKEDYPGVHQLLRQIAELHAEWRPDLFLPNAKLSVIGYRKCLKKAKQNPVLVAVMDGIIVGHLFAKIVHIKQMPHIKKRRVLYVGDLCVDGTCRGYGIGRRLMEEAQRLAHAHHCETLELNVYQCNESAVKFYERLGFAPQRLTLEKRLERDV